MPCQVGDRVGAVSSSKDGRAEIFGFGVFQGREIPDPELNVMFMGSPLKTPNPCILLDSGEKVYGCECWWGSEQAVKASLAECFEIVTVSPEEQRRIYNHPANRS